MVLIGYLFAVLSPVAYAQAQPQVVPVRSTANPSTVQLSVPIGNVTSVSGSPEYITVLYRYALGIVTLVAIIMVVYGGFRYLLGASTGDAKTGRKVIEDAIGGMAILFLAYVILYTVNPKTVRLSLPDIRRIQSVGLTAGSQTNQPGTSCAKDSDCTAGSFCLRTSLVLGVCADGQAGNICRCRGAGCDVTAEQAGGPTNHAGTGRVDCQAGLQCQEISTNYFVCNGGATGSACNESSEYMFPVDNAINTAQAARGVAGDVGTVTALAASGVGAPFIPLVIARSGYAAGMAIGSSPGVRQRSSIACTQPGQYCFQPSQERAGACVYGDYRDTAMFQGIPEYRTNRGLQTTVERCDLTEAQLRELPKSNGGCRNITNNNVDEFCVQHRYSCRGAAVCGRSAYAQLFAGTLRAYHSWENVPQQLRPETYFRSGCKKPIGAACQNDSECPSRCLQNRCSGFGALEIRDDVAPGSLRGLPTAAQVQYVYTNENNMCSSQSWTAIDLLEDERTSPIAVQNALLNVLFLSGTPDRFSCYPSRPTGAKCDFNAQCQSRRCVAASEAGPRITVPATFNAPLDNNAGLGTCG